MEVKGQWELERIIAKAHGDLKHNLSVCKGHVLIAEALQVLIRQFEFLVKTSG